MTVGVISTQKPYPCIRTVFPFSEIKCSETIRSLLSLYRHCDMICANYMFKISILQHKVTNIYVCEFCNGIMFQVGKRIHISELVVYIARCEIFRTRFD